MIQSAIIYFFLISSSTILAFYSSSRTSKLKLSDPRIILMFCIYGIINGIRYDVGLDYLNYLDVYQDYYRFGESITGKEGIWTYLTRLMAIHNIHFSVYFGVIAIIQFYFLIFSFKYYPKLLPYIIIIFFLGNWFVHYMNVLRQTLVISIFLFIVIRYPNIRFLKYLIVSLGCMMIHFSGILMILYYPILRKQFKLKVDPLLLVSMYILTNIIGQFSPVFNLITSTPLFLILLSLTDYEYYLNSSSLDLGTDSIVGLGFLLNVLMNVIIIFNYKKYVSNNQESRWFILYYFGIIIFSLFPTSTLLTRLFWFVSIFSIPVYALFVRYCLSLKTKQKFITLRFNLGLLLITIQLIIFTNSMIINPKANNAEYHFFWEYRKYTL